MKPYENLSLDKPKNIWTYESCYELAKTCTSKSEMKSKNQRAYIVALRHGWFNFYDWFVPTKELLHMERPNRVKWDYKTCYKIASQYDKLSDFAKNNPSVYTICNRRGWIEDFDWLSRGYNAFSSKLDNVYAYFFIEFNSVYIGRTIAPLDRDFNHRTNPKSSVLRFAIQNDTDVPEMTILESGLSIEDGLNKEDYYCKKYECEGWNVLNVAKTGLKSGSIGGLGKGKWNYKTCYAEAQKYKTLKDFRKKTPSAYNVSCKNKWIDDYTWFGLRTHWDYQSCYNEAKKYSRRAEFQRKASGAYARALKEGWLEYYTWFEPSKSKKKYNYQYTYNLALQFNKLSDFRKQHGRAYAVARKNGWINDYTWLEKKDISPKPVQQCDLSGTIIQVFGGAREASRVTGHTMSGIINCCNGKLNQHKGYIWKFKNINQN